MTSEQRKRRRSSSGVVSRSTEKSKPSLEKATKTKRMINGKKSVTADVDSSVSSDDSSSVVAVEKRLSRAKTVRRYRTVKQRRDHTDDDDKVDNTSNTSLNGLPETKTSKSCEKKHSVDRSLAAASGRNTGGKASSDRSTIGSRSSKRKHGNNSMDDKHRSTELSQGHRRKNKL